MIVLDTSVIIKWIQEEEYSDKARLLYKKHIDKKEEIVIPKLLLYESANTLTTKTRTSPSDIKTGLKFIFDSKLTIAEENEITIKNASVLAKKYKTTFYDMLFAVIAKNKNCLLITADKNFIQKTNFKFVKHISEV